MNFSLLSRAVLVSAVALSGCRTEEDRQVAVQPADTAAPAPAATTPQAPADGAVEIELVDATGQRVGTAGLTQEGDGVRVAIRATNLPGEGPRGIHFHETGSCEPPGFQSAGDHFDPQGRQHGLENPQGPHAGDLPNLPVRPGGAADTVIVNPRVTLREGQPNSLLRDGGTALVIHAREDDQRTDPSGNSGDRIACGVVARVGAAARTGAL